MKNIKDEKLVYHNDLNKFPIGKLSAIEMDIFFLICVELKKASGDEILISYNKIKELNQIKKDKIKDNVSLDRFIDSLIDKLINKNFVKFKTKNSKLIAVLFLEFELIDENFLRIKINPRFKYIFSNIVQEYTLIELIEFASLNKKYSKNLYLKLKQWKSVGRFFIPINELKYVFDISEKYSTNEITRSIIKPAIKELNDKNIFKNLRYENVKKGKTITGYNFIFDLDKNKI